MYWTDLPRSQTGEPTHRCLSVRVGQNPVDLHFAFVHVVDVHPHAPAHGVRWTVRLGRVVVVIHVLLQHSRQRTHTLST